MESIAVAHSHPLRDQRSISGDVKTVTWMEKLSDEQYNGRVKSQE